MQIIGKVNPDLSIKVLTALDLGTTVGSSSFIHPSFPPSILSLPCRPTIALETHGHSRISPKHPQTFVPVLENFGLFPIPSSLASPPITRKIFM